MTENKKIQKKELLFLFVLITLFVFISFDFSFMPLNNMENKLSKIVTEIKDSGVPYKEIYDNTPPLNYYIYLTAYKIFNLQPGYSNLRIFTLIYIIFFILLIYIVSRLMAGQTVAMLSSFFYVILIYKNNYSGIYSLPGLFAQFPVFLSLMFLFFIEKEYEKVDYFLSGFFLGVASYIIFPIKFIIFVPIMSIYLYWKKQKDKIKYIIWLISGFVLMELLAILWAVKNSILKEFIQFYFVYNFFSFFDEANLIKKTDEIFNFKYYLLFVFVFIYGIFKSFCDRKDKFSLILSIFSISICVISLFQKSMNVGYFYLLIPFISIMTSILLKDFIALLIKSAKHK